jgi:NAD+ synthase (glutamine-hydrolysing)
VGINICEDLWYPEGPAMQQSLEGAELIIGINASPYTVGKSISRERMLSTRAADNSVIVTFVNMVGAQDELVFEGGSLIINEKGDVTGRAGLFREDLYISDLDIEAVFMNRLHDPRRRRHAPAFIKDDSTVINVPARKGRKTAVKKKLEKKEAVPIGREEEVYSALMLGVSDYIVKNGFRGAIVGLSGGIDSSLVAAIAVDAIGAEKVKGIFMPSPFTSGESRDDVHELAENLGIELLEIPIDGIYETYLGALAGTFRGLGTDTTEENIQARIRGNILMALSNKFGSLVLTTGNKSEMSVGYATLYGDMAGGFAVIKDVPKTMAYELAGWRNNKEDRAPIPDRVMWKEPSAELRPGQKDSDSLPPYPVLDRILRAYIEDDKSAGEVVAFEECEEECTVRVIDMVDRNEYKRRQSPPGIKITSRAFGRDRRFPITNKYRGGT